ncbi:MAG: cobyric acid synthase [Nitrososphaerales archaeon]
MAKFLMVQGTSSNSGKSVLTAALCRIFSDEGYSVAPLKVQNMSTNVYITNDGLEMAKAQALQAVASRTEPSVYMNPILLKPMGDYVSRVVLLGREYRDMHARHYYSRFVMKSGLKYVRKAIEKLSSEYDIVVIEGAGSPAEINLARYDIANMKLAEMIKAPVIIVSDIERGGCFASMAGTLQLLERKHRALVKGFVINKFRGDRSILGSAIGRFEQMARKPVLGIIPFIDDMLLPSEDSLGMDGGGDGGGGGSSRTTKHHHHDMINVAVIRYPDAVNLSDFDSLLQGSDAINAMYLTRASGRLENADLVLLPSSRNLVSDLRWLHESGTSDRIRALHATGRPVIGIGGGYAMICRRILIGSRKLEGLGLLDATVYAGKDKLAGSITARTSKHGRILTKQGITVEGHLRQDHRVVRGRKAAPLLGAVQVNGRKKRRQQRFAEGSVSRDGLALGSCVYGLFDTPGIRNGIIGFLSGRKGISASVHGMGAEEFWDVQIQGLSDIVRKNVDLGSVRKLMGLN